MFKLTYTIEIARSVDKVSIKALFYKDTLQILKDNNAYLAGGALTSIFSNSPVNDLDIFFHKEEDFKQADIHFSNKDNGYKKTYESDNAITYKQQGNKPDIQLIKNPILLGTTETVFKRFDFNICMCAYYFRSNSLYFHSDYFKDLSRKRLVFNPDALHPLASIWRLQKYIIKGYSLSSSDTLKLITAASLELSKVKTNKDYADLLVSFRSASYKDTIKELLKEPNSPVTDLNCLYGMVKSLNTLDNPTLSLY